MVKKKIDKKAFKYKGKSVHIQHEGDYVYLVSFDKKGTKKFSIKKDKDGNI